MPMNNPYDRELTGVRKIISDVSFVLIVIFVVVFIGFVIVRQPKTIRTSFDPITVTVSNAAGKSELTSFVTDVIDAAAMSADFAQKYPTVTALLNKDLSVYKENTPYIVDDGESIAMAMSYNNTADKEIVTLDVVLIPLEEAGERLIVKKPRRYTFTYDPLTGVIKSELLRNDNFRLNFYRINVNYGAVAKGDYSMKLSSVISDREAELNDLFTAVVGGERRIAGSLARYEFTSVMSGKYDECDVVHINFNDIMYDYFESVSLPLPTGEYSIGFN